MFELINDIQQNCADFQAHAPPVDWSGLGGVPWLLGMGAVTLLGMVVFGMSEARRERQEARQALYRKAHAKANIRLNRMERQGYLEYRTE